MTTGVDTRMKRSASSNSAPRTSFSPIPFPAWDQGWHVDTNRGGDDPQQTARTVVHTVDAQLHRVMTRHGFDVDALMHTVNQLVPPPGRTP